MYAPSSLLFSSVSLVGALDPALLLFRIHRKVFVLKVLWDAFGPFPFDFFARGIQLVIRFPAF